MKKLESFQLILNELSVVVQEDKNVFIFVLINAINCFRLPHTYRDTMSDMGDQLWDPGQEWIQIFDNLLKHPQECQLS